MEQVKASKWSQFTAAELEAIDAAFSAYLIDWTNTEHEKECQTLRDDLDEYVSN